MVFSLRRIRSDSSSAGGGGGGRLELRDLKSKLENYTWKDVIIPASSNSADTLSIKHKHLPLVHPSADDLIRLCIPAYSGAPPLTKHPPRPYQWEAFAMTALSPSNSTILFLPTGAGKTLIAALMCAAYKRLNPGRLVLFLTDRVPLAFQQARAIEEQTGLVCLAMAGDAQLGLPIGELLKYDVLVCTVQLLINLLLRDTSSSELLEGVSCVIVDEVHHATRAHPFVVFFESFLKPFKCTHGWCPRVLGLTASPASGKGIQMKIQLDQLESTVDGHICTPILYRQSLEEATRRPQVHFIPVAPFTPQQAVFLAKQVADLKLLLEETLAVSLPGNVAFDELRSLVKTVKDADRLATIYHLLSRIELVNLIGMKAAAEAAVEGRDTMDLTCHNDIQWKQSAEETTFFSPKFTALLEFLNGLPVDTDSRTIVFVETKRAARLLASFLRDRIPASWNPQPFVGQASGTIEGMSWSDQQRPLLAMFHDGLVKLLIATSVLQEGLDVAACNHIVAFDPAWSLQAFVQSRGRARAQQSQYTLICAPDEYAHYCQLISQEQQLKGVVLKEMAHKGVVNLAIALTSVRLVQQPSSPPHIQVPPTFDDPRFVESSHSEGEADADAEEGENDLLAAGADYFHVEIGVVDLHQLGTDQACQFRMLQFPPIVFKRPLTLHQLFKEDFFFLGHSDCCCLCYDIKGGCLDSILGLPPSPNPLPLQLPFDSLSVGFMPDSRTFTPIIHAPIGGASMTVDPVRRCLICKSEAGFTLQCPFAFIDRFCLVTPLFAAQENDGNGNGNAFCLTVPLRRPPLLFNDDRGGERCTASSVAGGAFAVGTVLQVHLSLNASSAKALLTLLKSIACQVLLSKAALSTTAVRVDALQAWEKEINDSIGASENAYLIRCLLSETWSSTSLRIDQVFIAAADSIVTEAFVVDAVSRALKRRRFADPLEVLQTVQAQAQVQVSAGPVGPPPEVGESFATIKLLTWTPSRIIYHRPQLMMSNRVLRHFGPENFLRVRVRDETGEKLSMSACVNDGDLKGLLDPELSGTFGRLLEEGLLAADNDGRRRRFTFLAMSASQLRNHSVWFTCLDAEMVRQWMGDFREIRNVAKYVARLGQSLSASQATLTIEHFEQIDDWMSPDGEHCFSDGCGMMHETLARMIADRFRLSFTPTAYQIRFAGFKGVIAINPDRNDHRQLCLRPSMKKFDSLSRSLDILNYSQPFPAFLNRQIIMILSARGVPDEVFIQMQHDHLNELASPGSSSSGSVFGMRRRLPGLEGFDAIPAGDPFKRALIRLHYQQSIRDLTAKSRIAVPEGRVMMGVVDETGLLEEGQVFCQVDGVGVIDGSVVIAKNPCMHPGDVRVLEACRVGPLVRTHRNVLVFSRRGGRPIADMCSGSDLDGDLYFVSWDARLIPPDRQVPPMDYSGLPAVELSEPVAITHVHQFLLHYIANDRLGSIANAHLVYADLFPEGVKSPVCQALARIFALAVDFPKTGFMAQLPPQVRATEYPDFMEKADMPMYASMKIIGKLYRQLKRLSRALDEVNVTKDEFTLSVSDTSALPACASDIASAALPASDTATEPAASDTATATTASIYQGYRKAVDNCCRQYGFESEAHLWLGLGLADGRNDSNNDGDKELRSELAQSAQATLNVIVADTKKAFTTQCHEIIKTEDLLNLCHGEATAFPWLWATDKTKALSGHQQTSPPTPTNLHELWKLVNERTIKTVTECLSLLADVSLNCCVDWIALLLDAREIGVRLMMDDGETSGGGGGGGIDSLKAKCMELNLASTVKDANTLIIKIGSKRFICHIQEIDPSSSVAVPFASPADFWILFCCKALGVSTPVEGALPSAYFVHLSQLPATLKEWSSWLVGGDADVESIVSDRLRSRLNELAAFDSTALTAFHLLTWSEGDLLWTISRLQKTFPTSPKSSATATLRKPLKLITKPGSFGRSVSGAFRLFIGPIANESALSLTFGPYSGPRRIQDSLAGGPCFCFCIAPGSIHGGSTSSGSNYQEFADFWSHCHRQLALLCKLNNNAVLPGHELKLTLRRGQLYSSQVPSILLGNPFSLKLVRLMLDKSSFNWLRGRHRGSSSSRNRQRNADGSDVEDRFELKPRESSSQHHDESKIYAALESLLDDAKTTADRDQAPQPPSKKVKSSLPKFFSGKLALHFEPGTGLDPSQFTLKKEEAVYVCSLELFDRRLNENVGLRIVLDAAFSVLSIRSQNLRWIVADFAHASTTDYFSDERLILSTSKDLSAQFAAGFFDSFLQAELSSGQLVVHERFRENGTVHVREMIPTTVSNHVWSREFLLVDPRNGTFRLQTPGRIEFEAVEAVDSGAIADAAAKEAFIQCCWSKCKRMTN